MSYERQHSRYDLERAFAIAERQLYGSEGVATAGPDGNCWCGDWDGTGQVVTCCACENLANATREMTTLPAAEIPALEEHLKNATIFTMAQVMDPTVKGDAEGRHRFLLYKLRLLVVLANKDKKKEKEKVA
jgi:hypothetical protein